MDHWSISVVIPTFNGKHLLSKNIPFLMKAMEYYGGTVEIIVVDDASTDGTAEFLQGNYPGIILLLNERNLGFSETINRGILYARHELVLALNNDIQVTEDLFCYPLEWFRDDEVFSVTLNMIDSVSRVTQSLNRLDAGWCWYKTRNLQPSELTDASGEIPLFFASGGGSFFCKWKLLSLGGFDPIFHPFYVEDVDLSYRAWKAGWKCLFEARTVVYHETSSTILGIHKKRKVKFVGDRNRTLFIWLNITDPFLILRYFCFLPLSIIYDIAGFRKYKFVGFFWSIKYIKKVLRGRRLRSQMQRVTDRQVIGQISYDG